MPERPLATDALTSTNGHALRVAAPRRRRERGPVWNAVLFLLTCLTTLLAGTSFVGSPTFDAYRTAREPLMWILSGVPFAATLLGILVVHEFGHYFTARGHGAAVSLPYFIPAPPLFMAGTLGAIIRMRSAARDRNALFDIAAAGGPARRRPHRVRAAAGPSPDAGSCHCRRAGDTRGGDGRRALRHASRLDVADARRELVRARRADPLRARLRPWSAARSARAA